MKRDWTDKLRDKMTGYEEPAPEGLWENIKKELDNMPEHKKSHHTKFAPLWLSATAIAATILCLIGFFFANEREQVTNDQIANQLHTPVNQQHATKQQLAQAHRIQPLKVERLLASAKETSAKTTSARAKSIMTTCTTSTFATPTETKTKDSYSTQNAIHASAKEVKTASSESPSTPINETAQTRSEEKKATDKHEYNYPKHYYGTNLTAQNNGQSHEKSGWDVNMYVSNIPSTANNNGNNYGMLMAAVDESNTLQCDVIDKNATGLTLVNLNSPLQEIRSKNFAQETTTSIKHKQPVRFGITAKYDFDNHWALESGLTYTYLNSDIYSGTEANNYQSTQKLYYIGIPLNMIYTIWNNKYFSVYASAGGMGEYCIKGNLTTDYIIDSQVNSRATEKINNHRMQWSLNGAAGFQYSFMHHVGIYVEPGISYYFNDGSSLQTIYKEHPTNFSLKFGLRISIK